MAGRGAHAARRCRYRPSPPPRAGINGLGQPCRRPRRPGSAVRRAELCPAGGRRRALQTGLSRPVVAEVRRGGPPGMPCAQGEPGTGSNRRARTRRSAVPGLCRGCVDGSPFRRLQAVHQEGRPLRARPPAAAGLRLEAARPHHPGADHTMVRPLQSTAPGNANHALDLLRQIMNFAIDRDLLETNPARAVKRNWRQALTRFLSREENRPAPSGPGQADPQQQP